MRRTPEPARQPAPEPSAAPVASPPADFDEFYLASRRRLLLQAFALTGDLSAARQAVRHSFVVARHHWRKVSSLEDPETWVRPRAWAAAQRIAAAHIGHREKSLDADQKAVLDALHKLPDKQRRALVLNHLAAVSLPDIGPELGETREHTERLLQHATSATALALDCDSTAIRARLESLAPAVAGHGLPRAAVVRRSGRRRQRLYAAGGVIGAVALTLGMGAFVDVGNDSSTARAQAPEIHPVSAAMMLKPYELDRLPPANWRVESTGDNTRGTGLSSVCQERRFADPRGLHTVVRSFASHGRPGRHLTQVVEVSSTPGAAHAAFTTTTGWYSNCRAARAQLVRAYRVTGIGQEAQAYKLRVPGKGDGTYVVGIARGDRVTVSAILRVDSTKGQSLDPLLTVLSSGMRNLCASDDIEQCRAGTPTATPILPPPSGEAPGMLATTDLPPVGKIDQRWVGTDPTPARPNLAATTCDRTDFFKAGAVQPRSRTFLIPEAKLPKRFGITETLGSFRTTKAASALFTKVSHKMASCEKRQLGSTVADHDTVKGFRGSRFALWRLENEINNKRDHITYWMGVVQVGSRVVQVNVAPVPKADISADQFRDLLVRARDRMFELR